MHHYNLNILVADDHPIIRRGIILSVKKKFPRATLFECETPSEIHNILITSNISHAILDVTFPEKSTVHMLGELLAIEPGLQILFFSMHPKSLFEHTLKNYPNVLYCEKKEKQSTFEKLLLQFINNINDTPSPAPTAKRPKLSVMEEKVLQLILAGTPIKEIGQKLNIKSNTVSTYKRRILDKKGLDSILHISKIL